MLQQMFVPRAWGLCGTLHHESQPVRILALGSIEHLPALASRLFMPGYKIRPLGRVFSWRLKTMQADLRAAATAVEAGPRLDPKKMSLGEYYISVPGPRSSCVYWRLSPDAAFLQIQSFLQKTPLVARMASGIGSVLHYDPDHTSHQQFIRRLRTARSKIAEPASHYRPWGWNADRPMGMTPDRPGSLKRKASGAFIRGASRLRNRYLGRDYVERYRCTPWMSVRELASYREEKLMSILQHASKTVPYFRSRLDGFSPSRFHSDDFRQLPLMDRRAMAVHPEQYLSTAFLPVRSRIATSGTTSDPAVFFVDGESIKKREAVRWRGREWWGWRRGDPYAKFWGRFAPFALRRVVKDQWLENAFLLLNGYRFSSSDLKQSYQALMQSPCRYVYGYASVVYEAACEWLANGWLVPPGRLEGVILTSESITEAQSRVVESVFGAQVIREYGSAEFLEIAMECPNGGWHLNTDRLRVEFLREDGGPAGPLESARIVITDFDNLATPFIRYPIGDIGSYSEGLCSCGRRLPLLRELQGRDAAFLRLLDGTRAHSCYLAKAMERAYKHLDLPFLPWRAVQKTPSLIEISLLKRQSTLEDEIRDGVRVLYPTLEVRFRYGEEDSWTRGGKRNRFDSEVAPPPLVPMRS